MLLSDISIKRPVFATMMILALVVLGLFSYGRLNIDQWPDVEFPFVGITTTYPGASPEAVEREVTRKVEEQVNSVQGVKRIMSRSSEGLSVIYIQFRLGTKAMDALADVRAKVDGLRQELPRDIDPPVVSRFDIQSEPIMSLSVKGEGWRLRELTRLAEETVSRRFENIPGVSGVDVVGGMRREIHVLMLPDRMQALGISPDMVIAALQRENADVPAGRVERGNTEDMVRVKGRLKEPSQFNDLVVTSRGGVPVRLSQVARVEDAQEEERDVAYVDGQRAVAVEVRKVSGGNTVQIADEVKKAAGELNKSLPGGVKVAVIRDNSVWIRNSVEDVQTTLWQGALLTILVVFVFLNSWRSTVITGLTLPVSVIASFLAVYFFGFTLNMMTLMALSLAIGILIDDAIVVRENIVRHLERGEDHETAARRGTSEIGLAVLATSMCIVAVFVPVAFMGGIVGRFFYQFGITVAFAVLVSLFVSFTLDPMLSSKWYDPQAEGHEQTGMLGKRLQKFNRGFENMGKRYRRLISWALDHRALTMTIAAASFVISIALPAVGLVGGQFMPKSDEEETSITLETPVGSSLAYTSSKAMEIVRWLKTRPEVAFAYTTLGGGQNDNSVSKGQIYVKMVPKNRRVLSQEKFDQLLRRQLTRFPGVTARVMQLGFGGAQAPIQINLRGPNLEELQRQSDKSIAALRGVPGLVELKSSLEGRKPQWEVEVNRDAAADVGLSVGAVSSALRPLMAGEKAGDWEDATGLAHDVRVRLAPEARQSQADIARVPISTGTVDPLTGRPVTVPLAQVATLRRTGAPDLIRRQDLERVAMIEGNYENRPLTDVVRDVQERLKKVKLPPGYRFDFGGEQEDFVETVKYMTESLMLAIVFIYLILASQFGSFTQPLAIMLSLPLSLVGVTLALMSTRGTFNMMSMVGIIMLMGLVTKNAILLVDFANQARRRGLDRKRALIDAGETRLRPIVMTTLAMIFGMLPTALALGAGAEFRAPMAHAVIGGLITSTLLTLLVVPVVYTFLDDFTNRVGAGLKRWAGGPSEEKSDSEKVA
ncbi:MAG: efflux RND transporter permease subunit [Candidatus Eisenbacteria bacterium]|nr:efflux RND transporter permease subunit [Candidatus Eisenbacteria bacterium]